MEGNETNPFYEFFHEISVPLFDLTSTGQMIKGIAASMEIRAHDQFVSRLHSLTGGHPSFSRVLAAEAVRKRSSKDLLAVSDLAVAHSVMLENGSIDSFIKSNIWDPSTTAEKQVLLGFIRGRHDNGNRSSAVSYQLRQAEINLHEQGLIDSNSILMGALETWMRERGHDLL
jgi:hypothetical protein